jgi:hypothetical protein
MAISSFFDIQPAEPGTFTVPGVIDLEIYRPGDIIETSWIYFKGDPQAGPLPGHPFERPFNDSAKFSIDVVRDNDTAEILHEIMLKFLELSPSLQRSIDRGVQHPPILPLSGKVPHHLVGQVTTPCIFRDSTARASTTSSAKCFIAGRLRRAARGTLLFVSSSRLTYLRQLTSAANFRYHMMTPLSLRR